MKPLSKERLEYYNSRDARESDEIEELLAAEAFWREAVKNAPETEGHDEAGVSTPTCIFCGGEQQGEMKVDHKDYCLWVLAQD